MTKHYPVFWLDKPYYSFHAYCQNTFHEKIYKIALDAGMTCPNRDGTLGNGGCIFCSKGGSGDFAVKMDSSTISEQIQKGLSLFHGKKTGKQFIAYFQAYTNTYAPISYLQDIYTQALDTPEVVGISIATRPDCLSDEVLSLLQRLKAAYPGKFIWIELGLQTIHEETARYIRRGYNLDCFTQAVWALSRYDIPVIVHVIIGLPHETKEMLYATIRYLNQLPIQGMKLQLLHILKETDLADEYLAGKFEALTLQEYTDLLIGCLERLKPEIVVHRITGDGPRDLLIAPLWSLQKRNVLNTIHHQMQAVNTWQGRLFSP